MKETTYLDDVKEKEAMKETQDTWQYKAYETKSKQLAKRK